MTQLAAHMVKIAPEQNQYRYYAMTVTPTLFGDWSLVREWGRIGRTVAQVNEARIIKETQKSVFLVSRKIGNTVLGRDIRDMATEHGIPLLDTAITQRVAFAEALTIGKTIQEWSPNSEAAAEVAEFMNELVSIHEQEELQDITQATAHA